jgi:hypothetical protein
VAILDIFPKMIKYERESVYLLWAVFIPVYVLTVYLIIMNAITGGTI